MISRNARFAFAWSRCGSFSRMFASLWHQSRCPRVSGHTSRTAAQKPSAPSPTATTGARMPRRFKSRNSVERSGIAVRCSDRLGASLFCFNINAFRISLLKIKRLMTRNLGLTSRHYFCFHKTMLL